MLATTVGEERTFEQDPEFAFRVLADIALRARSPAVNDPTTAIQALDAMEACSEPRQRESSISDTSRTSRGGQGRTGDADVGRLPCGRTG